MRSGANRAVGCGPRRRAFRLAAALVLASSAAGCAGAVTSAPTTTGSAGRGATVAFESIDGPPVRLYETLVATLAEEAVARRVKVVSRTAPAEYRVRIYLAAHVDGRAISIAWVWDVYDAEKRRALRITGEAPGERKGPDAWSVADDPMMRRIARASLDQLVTFLETGPPPAEPPSGPDADGPAVAAVPVPDTLALATTPPR